MTVYLQWQKYRWAIKCPNCQRCNKVIAKKDGVMFCGYCVERFWIPFALRKREGSTALTGTVEK